VTERSGREESGREVTEEDLRPTVIVTIKDGVAQELTSRGEEETCSCGLENGKEHSGLIIFFKPRTSAYWRYIPFHGTAPLSAFSTKHKQKWDRTAQFYLPLKLNTTLKGVFSWRAMRAE
jgi:hypothetical protein